MELKVLRKDRNFSQKDVADGAGVSVSAYSRYETGEREPDIQTLIRLADFFRVSIDDIVGRKSLDSDSDPVVASEIIPTSTSSHESVPTTEAATPADPASPASSPASAPEKVPPFTPAQLEYFESWKREVVSEVLAAMREEERPKPRKEVRAQPCECQEDDVA